MTIWVVEHGEYSDYRVVGLFSTPENAQRVADLVGGTVAAWPVDPRHDELNQGFTPWTVMMARDGVSKVTPHEHISASDIEITREFGPHIWPCGPYGGILAGRLCMVGTIWAKDGQGAVKRANEIRTKAIAEGRWP